MDINLMCQQLPKSAPKAVLRYALKKHLDDLGGERTVFKRVNISVVPDLLQEIMPPEMWEEYETSRRSKWAAECVCSVCGEVWHTGWVNGSFLKSIALVEGEDGLTYPCLDDYDPGIGTFIEVAPNDGFLCPFCSAVTTLTHASSIRGGRTWRLLIASVENVGIYTTIFYWLVARTIDEDGCVFSRILPWNAYVIDEAGALKRFIYTDGSGWRHSKQAGDAFYSKYSSMDGDLYNYRRGGYACDQVPNLAGCTGEKTGLQAYMTAGGQLPVLYMKTWRRHRTIENLVNSGWAALIEQNLQSESNDQEIPYAICPGVFFGSAKPHEMLHMDRISFRELRRKNSHGWHLHQYECWLNYLESGGTADAVMFDNYYKSFKLSGINAVLSLREMCPQVDLPKIDRYLSKQGLRHDEVQLLLDTWRMTIQLFGRTQLSSEEMWPRNLFDLHERLSRQVRLEQSKDDWSKFLSGFIAVRERFRELEWTDGELCVVLPKDNGDLIREGDVLRHCVYSYGADHVSGRHTIFFIRKYRRPERCYYTLDINMTGQPKEQQLHGYGNERHGPHKEYSHSIPNKVRLFCDRWKSEVLMPWYREQEQRRRQQADNVNGKEAKTA